jgi:hypothetical protein
MFDDLIAPKPKEETPKKKEKVETKTFNQSLKSQKITQPPILNFPYGIFGEEDEELEEDDKCGGGCSGCSGGCHMVISKLDQLYMKKERRLAKTLNKKKMNHIPKVKMKLSDLGV